MQALAARATGEEGKACGAKRKTGIDREVELKDDRRTRSGSTFKT